MPPQHHHPKQPSPVNSSLIIVWVGTLATCLVVTISSLLMLLRTWEESDVPPVAQGLWYISGLAFIPCFGLMLVVTALRKHRLGTLLGVLLITSGIAVGAGWFIYSDGSMPAHAIDTVVLLAAVFVSLVTGLVVMRASRTLRF